MPMAMRCRLAAVRHGPSFRDTHAASRLSAGRAFGARLVRLVAPEVVATTRQARRDVRSAATPNPAATSAAKRANVLDCAGTAIVPTPVLGTLFAFVSFACLPPSAA